ncbi:MAG: DUF4136 domain-containing protein [Gammaproteobacteria bacterium]|nr:MAG: DUF4136 domain-containing protein [Gammaproteobacteria bacterium]TDJ41456.1 MAG: DUF4136 domain-containing protein [Gammaproteobacteria bacterium]
MCRWIAATLVVICAGCATVKVQYDSDPNANFSAFEKFSWISDFPLIAPENDLLIEYRSQPIMSATRDILTRKGYRFVEDRREADFVLSFTIGDMGGQLVETSYPPEYRGRWYWRGPVFRPGAAVSYAPGQLRIEVFDASTKAPVWVGYARKDITGADQYNATRLLDDIVTQILRNFPAS